MSQQNVNTTASESKESSGEKAFSVQLAQAGQRLTFFEGFIGHLAPKAPRLLTHWMRSHSRDYAGGYWEYFSTSNGACFAVPGFEGKKHFQILSRGFSAEMSAEAAGVSAMLCVLKCLAWQTWSENGNDPLIGKLNHLESALWEYALTLDEKRVICLAVA
ncbi:antirestriction protein [Pantoea sp. Morm]|uniref:antirestriction protein n=1 Tax=Pantoea sp. Morm TaxID=2601250 RepID=UPI0031FDC0D3